MKKWAYIQLRLKAMVHSAAAVHFTSQHEARESPGFIKPDLHVIETLGIDVDEFDSQASTGPGMRERFNISSDARLLIFVGRLHPIQGLQILRNAFRNLAISNSNLRLLICGPGEDGYDVDLKQSVSELKLDHPVSFSGMINRGESADDFEIAVRTLIDSPELLQKYAANCQNTVGVIFSWSSVAQRWINRYRSIGKSV